MEKKHVSEMLICGRTTIEKSDRIEHQGKSVTKNNINARPNFKRMKDSHELENNKSEYLINGRTKIERNDKIQHQEIMYVKLSVTDRVLKN